MPGAEALDSRCEREESELIARARSGQVEAFAQIYDHYAPKILPIARRMPGPDDAHDLLHDVFVEAWQCIREYDATRASLLTWLAVNALAGHRPAGPPQP
jgi:RNA polymerase sigma-70 factor (ECF subfamily)